MRQSPSRLMLVAAAALLATLVAIVPAAAQRDFGRTTIRVPDATTAGSFPGTWVFENRMRQLAVWLREADDGRLELRVKQVMLGNAETFVTDWQGDASYSYPGVDGEVRIVIDESDADEARGSWFWRSTKGDASMTERGRFTLFRSDDGRYAVLRFDELSIERDYAGNVSSSTPPRVWSLRKASRRLADWDELAF